MAIVETLFLAIGIFLVLMAIILDVTLAQRSLYQAVEREGVNTGVSRKSLADRMAGAFGVVIFLFGLSLIFVPYSF